MITLQVFTFNPFAENTYVLAAGGEAFIVDPGCYEREEQERLKEYILSRQLHVKAVLNTHCHIDHVLGNAFACSAFGAPLRLHPLEERVLRAVATYAPNYGFHRYQEKLPDSLFLEREQLRLGGETLEILFVPGHSPGHVALYNRAGQWLIGGDVLFHRSIGRTDLPGGDQETLLKSIQNQFFTLPDEVVVYPGHGPETSVGAEKKHNPYCAWSPAAS